MYRVFYERFAKSRIKDCQDIHSSNVCDIDINDIAEANNCNKFIVAKQNIIKDPEAYYSIVMLSNLRDKDKRGPQLFCLVPFFLWFLFLVLNCVQ